MIDHQARRRFLRQMLCGYTCSGDDVSRFYSRQIAMLQAGIAEIESDEAAATQAAEEAL